MSVETSVWVWPARPPVLSHRWHVHSLLSSRRREPPQTPLRPTVKHSGLHRKLVFSWYYINVIRCTRISLQSRYFSQPRLFQETPYINLFYNVIK